MSYETIEVAKFDGRRDYALWKTKILAHLGILGLKEALKIEEDGEKSDGKVEDEKRSLVSRLALEEKQRKAKRMIIQSIEDKDLRKKIMKEDTAAGMFQVLERIYTSSFRRIDLCQKLYGFKMNESLSIAENIDEFQGLVSDLRYMNVSVPDEEQAMLLLRYENLYFLQGYVETGETNHTKEAKDVTKPYEPKRYLDDKKNKNKWWVCEKPWSIIEELLV